MNEPNKMQSAPVSAPTAAGMQSANAAAGNAADLSSLVDKRPTGEFRHYSQDHRLVAPVWQQKFHCRDANGIEGFLWFDEPVAQNSAPAEKAGGRVITEQVHADLRLAWKLLEDAGHQAAADRLFQFMGDKPRAVAADADAIAEDTARLNLLDTNVHKFRMGWRLGQAPVGNLSVQSIIMGGQPIREAIDAAREAAMIAERAK